MRQGQPTVGPVTAADRQRHRTGTDSAAPRHASAVGLAAAGMSLIAACYGLARFAYGLFVPTFRAEFHLDAATAGTVAAGSYAGYCVAIVVATAATSRWGARPVAAAAGACATAGTAVIAAAPGPFVLALGVVLAGSSTGLASPPMAEAVARFMPPRLEPRLQTVVNAGTGLGVLVSGPVALLLAGSWRWAWAAFSAASLVVTLWVWFTVPRRSGLASDSPAPDGDRGDSLGVRARVPRGGWRLLVAAFSMGLASAATWTFGRDLVTAAGNSTLTGVTMWIALGAAGLLGAFAGDLTTRAGPARCWTIGMLALGGATAVLALAASSAVVAVAAGAAFGAVYIALTGLLLLWGARVLPRRPVVGVGAAFLLLALGQAVGAPVLGAVADAVTLPGAFLVATAAAALGAGIRPRDLPG
ncbi:MFS transporter [Actinopolymorpha rutila]|uniref:Putative MFS family arabinose efflux permease n=1 Tax=Actinopolymorpha rutila TaxID=446787 RepID=A0A852ZFP2_9ACTN|nr:MFS transporter [Actinopolymorpha rutila]NYH90512.1 putative MFS family arabinose efflux permease [Actinopolymorpha rutila]